MYCPIPVQRVHGGQLELFPNTPQQQTLFVVDLLDIALAWDGMQYILFFWGQHSINKPPQHCTEIPITGAGKHRNKEKTYCTSYSSVADGLR